jgi:hypothetical protein
MDKSSSTKMNAYRISVGKPEEKKPFGRPRCSWMDNTKMDLKEIGWGGVDYIALTQDRDGGGLLSTR